MINIVAVKYSSKLVLIHGGKCLPANVFSLIKWISLGNSKRQKMVISIIKD